MAGTETEKELLVPGEDKSATVHSTDGIEKNPESLKSKHLSDGPKVVDSLYGLRYKVTGSCMCKLSIVFYLLVCVGVSVLVVGLYGHQHESDLEEQPLPWIPGTVRPTIKVVIHTLICSTHRIRFNYSTNF